MYTNVTEEAYITMYAGMQPQKQTCNQPSVLCAATTLASAQTNRSKVDCANMQTKLRKARVGNGHESPGKKLKRPSAQHLQASSALCQVGFCFEHLFSSSSACPLQARVPHARRWAGRRPSFGMSPLPCYRPCRL